MLSEQCLPQSGREFGDARGGMLTDALEYVDQIGIGIDTCNRQVTIKLWMMPTCLAPSSVQQKSHDFLPAYFAEGRPAVHGKAVHGFTPCRSSARDAGRG
jgi:hypothetical protein